MEHDEQQAEHERRFRAGWDRRSHDPRGALELAGELATSLGDDPGRRELGLLRLLEGSCHWRLGRYTVALEKLLAAQELLPADEEPLHPAALIDLAIVHNYFGQPDEATTLLLEALRLYEAADDDGGRSDVLNNLGITFWNRGELEEATRAYRESLELRERVGDANGIAACHNNLGKVQTDQGDYEHALISLRAALQGWTEVDNPRGIGVALNNIGLVLHHLGDLEGAVEHYRRSLEVKARIGDRQGTCETTTHLGRILTASGRTEEAESLLATAVAEGEELGLAAEVADAYLAMAELHEARGDHEAALRWFRWFHRADRNLFNDRSTERLQALQITYKLERAEREGATDGLTGLANRRALDRHLHAGFARSRAEGTPLSLVLMDLDGFKAINDGFGHAIGDEVLRTMAGLLRDHTRTADLPARYGGEEFAVVLPDTPLTEAIQAARQLCDRVRGYDWSRIDPELSVTVSVGVAAAQDVADVEELLLAADRHLYRAKHGGKDRVEA